MRILDRYVVRQFIPVILWCLVVFIFMSCLIDLFGRLDEILRHHIPIESIARYYLQFIPIVFIRAAPFALLLSASFVAMRLSRYQELLAMHASGTSPLRSAIPFLFIGWLMAVGIFAVNETIMPRASAQYERMKTQLFKGQKEEEIYENIAYIDRQNRLYHARSLDLEKEELTDLTVLEHDRNNRPIASLYASRAIYTKHGWLLLRGLLYQSGPSGKLQGAPRPFVEQLIEFPVDPHKLAEPQTRPETMRYGELARMIRRLHANGMTNTSRYEVELDAKLTFPLMNVILCLIAFVGSTRQQLRGTLKGLGTSLALGVSYYLIVAVGHGITRQWPIPVLIGVWVPHMLVVWWCVRQLEEARG